MTILKVILEFDYSTCENQLNKDLEVLELAYITVNENAYIVLTEEGLYYEYWYSEKGTSFPRKRMYRKLPEVLHSIALLAWV